MRLRDRGPLPPGYLSRVTPDSRPGFSWPRGRFECPGYTSKGKAMPCGIVFENASGTTVRCPACSVAHTREYQRQFGRVRRARRRKATP